MDRKKVVVAMSGGVDSSVAAALLKEEGFDVVGVSMQLWDYSDKESSSETGGSCCSLEDIYDARRVADTLGIPHYVVNMEEVFSREVVDYFVKGYITGGTPNPCIKCNEVIKFEVLLKKALGLGVDSLATGHYARVEDKNGVYRLLRAVDKGKDQSYFLFTLTQSRLERVLFPLGAYTKAEVRGLARKFNLRVSEKGDSQEICFIEGRSYSDFLSSLSGPAPGDIVDGNGNILGAHKGLFRYTIGQRKGLDIKDGSGPFYVTGMDMEKNRLIVGKEDGLFSKGLYARGVTWVGRRPAFEGAFEAKIRYRTEPAPCSILPEEGGVTVIFSTPQKSVTPGQAVVFYSGEEVLGGGWIERAIG